jgi:ARG and Rhodanese-Phosphatase-superfamily-associated Protein domain
MKLAALVTLCFVVIGAVSGFTGGPAHESLRVLAPITHGNLTIFPIVGGPDYDTSPFITLDEGVRAGTVVVTEQGSLQGLVRRGQPVTRHAGAQVNELVLVNNSDRPLLLLAGEIVTGGKQDRVIGADRLVPPKSDPIDLSVFCVEPGRWVGQSEHFSSMKSQMAQPSVRVPAMAAKDQHEVWNEVAIARQAVQAKSNTAEVTAGAPPVQADNADLALNHTPTTSYARTMASPRVQATIETVAGSY